ncbi:MAG: glycosyltransferase [Melioribacteraceae bacterium]|nr:glycosyltransferase [Melioribacteraceae bacterium]
MITVLMPTYNCAKYLLLTIKSILNQTYKDFEFLIINDGSTDCTDDIVLYFNDERINYIKRSHNGKSECLNYGLEKAKFDTIIHMDSDDIAHPNLLNDQIQLYNSLGDSYWVGTNYFVFNDENKKIIYPINNPLNHNEIIKKMSLHGSISHAGSIVNKKVIIQLGGYRNLDAFEDYDIWLKGIKKVKFANNKNYLMYVRYRENSLSRNNLSFKLKLHYKIQKPFYGSHFKENFNIESDIEECLIRGWREYFFGNRFLSLRYWIKNPNTIFYDYRVLFAALFILMPTKYFIKFNEFRLRFRIIQFIKQCDSNYKKKQKYFSELIENYYSDNSIFYKAQ